jgi:isoleucyl-tRNA synthetase
MEYVAKIFATEGSSAWFSRPVSELAPAGTACPRCHGTDLDKTHDIVDVWFESGVSWAAVADGKLVPKGGKVDLYLEGADQHRGWFHSSLLAAVAARGSAPYKAVLTHGWVLDERGKVYSKSEIEKARAAGIKTDYVEPSVWMEKNGAELLRLWVAAADYQSDVVFSKTILDQLGESYRKIRNTCRFLLSNLYDFVPARDVAARRETARAGSPGAGRPARAQRPDPRGLRALQLPRGRAPDGRLPGDGVGRIPGPHQGRALLRGREFARAAQRADRPLRNGQDRRHLDGARHVLLGAGRGRRASAPDRHALRCARPDLGKTGRGDGSRWEQELRPLRDAVLAKLEAFRATGHKALHASVTVTPTAAERASWKKNLAHLIELCEVSSITLAPSDAPTTEVVVTEAPLPECPRCWRRTGAASGHAQEPNLCIRCASVVSSLVIP